MTNVDLEMLINSVGKWRIEPSNIIDMPTMGIRTNPYDRWSALINRPTYTSDTSLLNLDDDDDDDVYRELLTHKAQVLYDAILNEMRSHFETKVSLMECLLEEGD